eukprot:gnl/TRDRNA2_/TRDRNA2_33926_c1_seq1.p1 gnl/TRDRNA2_/TRDRNA2_33926_c1~~gnl/TRDRNA2_/TRDRNA2_33926_c1_seq1.p1  ORF type:complete len:385 (-),score=52.69 gnl/TRDRNA2_/TRDRNA2_33926_c1_seq1:234-1337(-)
MALPAIWLSSLLSVAMVKPQAAQLSIPTQVIAPGVEMPVVMVGTWTSGTNEDAKNIVQTWVQLGGTGVDEALVYGNQAIAAEALNESGLARSKLFVESKIPGCGGDALARSWVEQCLAQLSTSYLDLMLIHAPRGPDCLATWRVLEEYQSRGILKSIGVSNFQVSDLELLLAKAKVKPAVNQVQFNVFYHDDALVAFCNEHNITVQSWGPLGGAHHWFDRSVFTEPTISAIAQAHQISAAQVALRWVIQHGLTLVFLSGDEAHQSDDATIFTFELTTDEMAKLDALQHHPHGAIQQKHDATIPQLMGHTQAGPGMFSRSGGVIMLAAGLASGLILAAARYIVQAPLVSTTRSGQDDLGHCLSGVAAE